MSITRCKKGHYYDLEKFSQCPHCGIFVDDEDEKTMQLLKPNDLLEEEKTIAMRTSNRPGLKSDQSDDKTISFYKEEKGADFITGWLVCTKGPEKGRDYRLRHGFNRIGRDHAMDVAVMEDALISRESSAAIVYESKTNCFYAVSQSGGTSYVNGKLLESPQLMKTGDIMEIGKSEFEFIAFCREGRIWEKD